MNIFQNSSFFLILLLQMAKIPKKISQIGDHGLCGGDGED